MLLVLLDGTKKVKKCSLCFDSPRIVTPRKIVTLIPSATIIDVVIVNPYGTFPLRLAKRIKKKSE